MRWILISLAILLLVPFVACNAGTGSAAYNRGWREGVEWGREQGRELGYFSGFRDGAHIGYKNGYYEARIGLESSMDWFFTDYPQYR